MKKLAAKIAITATLALLIGAAFTATSRGASGNYLYWATTPVQTGSLRTCYDFANDAMRLQNFQNIRRTGNEVAGFKGGTYAAITCIGTAPRATAVVMATGGDANETGQVRNDLRSKVAGIIRFD